MTTVLRELHDRLDTLQSKADTRLSDLLAFRIEGAACFRLPRIYGAYRAHYPAYADVLRDLQDKEDKLLDDACTLSVAMGGDVTRDMHHARLNSLAHEIFDVLYDAGNSATLGRRMKRVTTRIQAYHELLDRTWNQAMLCRVQYECLRAVAEQHLQAQTDESIATARELIDVKIPALLNDMRLK